jgi:predicted O-methyltransferase YrrM
VTIPGGFARQISTHAPDRYAEVREAAIRAGMAVDPLAARLGAVLVRATRASYILDLGAGNGYRAFHLAAMMGTTGYIEAIETDPRAVEAAEEFSRHYGFTERIRFRSTEIVASVRGTNGPFDLIVIASPGRTFPALLPEIPRLVRAGGAVLALGLDIAADEPDADGVTRFLERTEQDDRFLMTMPASGEWALAVRLR